MYGTENVCCITEATRAEAQVRFPNISGNFSLCWTYTQVTRYLACLPIVITEKDVPRLT